MILPNITICTHNNGDCGVLDTYNHQAVTIRLYAMPYCQYYNASAYQGNIFIVKICKYQYPDTEVKMISKQNIMINIRTLRNSV